MTALSVLSLLATGLCAPARFGHALVAWEYLEGARTWMTPGFVAVWLCKLVGADSPATSIHVVKLVFVLLSGAAAPPMVSTSRR